MTAYSLLLKVKYSKIYTIAFVLLIMIIEIGCKKSVAFKEPNSYSSELNQANKWLEETKLVLNKQGKANIDQIIENID
ncbi:MAG: hypothetical protein ABI151_05880 [Chitinophagaceae bacterium]